MNAATSTGRFPVGTQRLTTRVFAHSRADAWLVAVAFAHGLLVSLLMFRSPNGVGAVLSALFVGFGVVYTSNTVAHCHIHRPIFASRIANRALSLWMTVALLVPQTVWAERHLRHHAGNPARTVRTRVTARILIECIFVAAVVLFLAIVRPFALLSIFLPGFAFGMTLCHLQGYFEHDRGTDLKDGGVSHYGWAYNFFWFNDGYHAEHHQHPRLHWTNLRTVRSPSARMSAVPPLLRWTEGLDERISHAKGALLNRLERAVLPSPILQRWILSCHRQALAPLLAQLPALERIAVVGGGLFPRTVMLLAELAPDAKVIIIDASEASLSNASALLEERGLRTPPMIQAWFDPQLHRGFDLVVFPLALVGSPQLIERTRECNEAVLTHDWIWQTSRVTRVVSMLLCKRLNLTVRSSATNSNGEQR